MYQISINDPSVNWIFYEAVTKDRAENELNQLINIGTCGLQSYTGLLKSGAEATNWNIKKVLQSPFQILHGSPARR